MKKIFFTLVIALMSLTVSAQINGINIGDDYNSVKSSADKLFGEAILNENNILAYSDVTCFDEDWEQIAFTFQDYEGKKYLDKIVLQLFYQDGHGGDPSGYLENLRQYTFNKYNWHKDNREGIEQYYAKYSDDITIIMNVTRADNMTIDSVIFTYGNPKDTGSDENSEDKGSKETKILDSSVELNNYY